MLSPRIWPTVCTNRSGRVIGPCLSALSESALSDTTIVVLSGLAGSLLRERSREVERLIPEATLVVESKGGLSRARNAALAAVAPGDVVAYIDDDAVIAPTWPSAMRKAWLGAPEDVALVGGPVKPLFLAPRPRWLSDYLLAGLSIVDHGPTARFLDEATDGFLFGANLSLVARHAQSVGGFDPRRGPAGKGPGFGDDIDIQLRLSRGGFRTFYDPEAAVFHRIPVERLRRGSMLRRRYAQGQEQGRGRRHVGIVEPARGLGAGLIRAGMYTCAGKPDAAMDNLAYSAQCVGVVSQLLHKHTGRRE